MGRNLVRPVFRTTTQADNILAAENAANLAYALVSLNNNFELEEFALKRQGALNALVVCAPQYTAP